jgi:hypothetical protein
VPHPNPSRPSAPLIKRRSTAICRTANPLRKQAARAALPKSRSSLTVCAAAAVQTQTLKIGTRGSPLALAQAYLTRDLLQVIAAALALAATSLGALPLADAAVPCTDATAQS